jgi:hypothetical protein
MKTAYKQCAKEIGLDVKNGAFEVSADDTSMIIERTYNENDPLSVIATKYQFIKNALLDKEPDFREGMTWETWNERVLEAEDLFLNELLTAFKNL